MATPNIVPRSDSEGGLGTASKYWASAYIDNVYVSKIGRDAHNLIDFSTDNQVTFRCENNDKFFLNGSRIAPSSNDGLALGSGSLSWSDLFLASGAVINFDNGNVTLTHSSNRLTLADSDELAFGTGNDLQIYHDATDSYIHNDTGDLRIENDTDSGDIVFRSDNGSGGLSTYFRVDGGLQKTIFPDNQKLSFGSSGDLDLYHDATNSYISNSTGHIVIENNADDADIIFKASTGTNAAAAYLTLDGANTRINVEAVNGMQFSDNIRIKVGSGTGGDLRIYHNGTTNNIEAVNGNLRLIQGLDDMDITFESDDGAGGITTYFYLDGSSATHDGSATTGLYTNWPDKSAITLGTSHDLHVKHNGTDTTFDNYTGHLKFTNYADGSDIVFYTDNGSGGTTEYIRLDGSAGVTKFDKITQHADNIAAKFGYGNDLVIYHDGTNNYIVTDNGNLTITNNADDKDVVFQASTSTAAAETYIQLDGSLGITTFYKNLYLPDNTEIRIGTGSDLKIYHDGSQSILNNQTGNLEIVQNADGADIIFKCDNGSGGAVEYMRIDGGSTRVVFSKDVKLQDNNILRFGSGNDLQIVHNGTDSTITNIAGNFNFYQNTDGGHIRFYNDNGSGGTTEYVRLDGSDVSTSIKTIKVLMPNLPTSDPTVAGQLWNDSGTLKISAG